MQQRGQSASGWQASWGRPVRRAVAWLLLAVALAAAAAAAQGSAFQSTPPSPQVRVSTQGDDARCARGGSARACLTLPRAYEVARPGDLVEISPGTYPGFTLSGNKGGRPITFRAGRGGLVNFFTRVDLVDLEGVTFDGLQFRAADGGDGDLLLDKCNANIVIRNARASRKFGVLEGNKNILFVGGSWGGYREGEDSGIFWVGRESCADGSVPGPSRNIVFDRVLFHDVYYKVPAAEWGGNHPDCLQVDGAVDGLTIRNSRFVRCGNTFLLVTPDLGPAGIGDVLNMTVENNLFWLLSDDSYFGIQFNNNTEGLFCGNLVFRNNTYFPSNPAALGAFSTVRVECRARTGYRDALVTGNVFQRASGICNKWSTWSYNVFEQRGPSCGSNVRHGPVKVVDREHGNFHLLPGSRAVDRGNPKSYPPRDIDGQRRPTGRAPDAGYDERRLSPASK